VPYIKESKNFLSKKNIEFIEKVILSPNLPYYLVSYKEDKRIDNDSVTFGHLVQNRLESGPPQNVIKSPSTYDQTKDILNNFLKSINQKYYFFTRIVYNLTIHNKNEEKFIHTDHDYKHKQIIIYLNNGDPLSKTCILDEKHKLIKKITPKKYTGVCFESLPHYQVLPRYDYRVVLVATFI
jgi:hypothetical protein|tara:strand:- start:259 stop:801 length:543 start_codon:yes stop_codon:yes gene_type:complete